ncbi:hypothetical protein ACFL6P_07040, partial [Candidatus Latescibacterota bacterium]
STTYIKDKEMSTQTTKPNRAEIIEKFLLEGGTEEEITKEAKKIANGKIPTNHLSFPLENGIFKYDHFRE